VENPQALLSEIEGLNSEKFDIIYVSKVDDEVSVLSHDQKLEFLQHLKCKGLPMNSGLVAKTVVDRSESSEEVEYK
jgi:hypothetical protein